MHWQEQDWPHLEYDSNEWKTQLRQQFRETSAPIFPQEEAGIDLQTFLAVFLVFAAVVIAFVVLLQISLPL